MKSGHLNVLLYVEGASLNMVRLSNRIGPLYWYLDRHGKAWFFFGWSQ
jgi:hypothetical protein